MSHAYKPGDPIEVQGKDGEWRHRSWNTGEQFVYVGEWAGEVLVGFSEYYDPYGTEPEYVRPYTPPVEIPEGWTLMRCGDVDFLTDEVYDSDDPHNPWIASTVGLQPGVLVVARRRADA